MWPFAKKEKKTIILFEEEMLSQSSNKNGLEPISCQKLQPSCHIPFYTRIFCSAMYFRRDCFFIYDLNCRGAQLQYRGGPKKIHPRQGTKLICCLPIQRMFLSSKEAECTKFCGPNWKLPWTTFGPRAGCNTCLAYSDQVKPYEKPMQCGKRMHIS